jgi:hypothetical protein
VLKRHSGEKFGQTKKAIEFLEKRQIVFLMNNQTICESFYCCAPHWNVFEPIQRRSATALQFKAFIAKS